jgi:hypothetical protein
MMVEFVDAFRLTCVGDCGLTAEFQRGGPGSFRACVDELKSRGWRIFRDRHGEWHHRCGKCKADVAANILDSKVRSLR